MTKKITCKTGLTKSIISKEVFDREIALCKMLSKDHSCCWGNCATCGVLPLLYKLYHGKLLESKKAVRDFRKKILKNVTDIKKKISKEEK